LCIHFVRELVYPPPPFFVVVVVVVVKKVKGAPNTKRLWCVSCQFQDDGRRYWAQFKWMPDSPSEIRRRIHQLDSGRSVTASAELRSALAQQ
jgi:hypothetical protein